MEIINDVNGLFEFQDLGARTELKNKANLVQSKNLFDMTSYLNFLNALATRAIVNGTLDNIDSSSFTFTTTGHDCYTNGWTASFNTIFKIQVQQNTTYTMSWDFNGSDGFTSVFFNGVTESGNIVQTKNSKKTLTFTTKEDTTFITVRFGITDGGTSATIGKIQVEEGTENTTYLPSMVSEGVNEVDKAVADNTKSIKANKTSVDNLSKDFNTYKTSNDSKVNNKVDSNNFDTYKATTDKAIDKCAADIATNSALISKNQINVTTDKSTSIVLNDSSDCNIVDLICGEKDNSKQIAFYRKNLFDFNSTHVYGNDSVSNIVVDKDNKSISFTTSETGAYSGVYFRHNNYPNFKGYGIDYTKLSGKPVALSFDIQSDINCKIGIQFIQLNSYNYFDITPTKQRIVVTDTVDINKLNKTLCFYTNKTKANITISNIQIEVNNTATDYEDCDCQKVTLANADVNSLHTYYPSTTVISDSDVQLSYVADTKHYIDNKFNELATAIVAHESEVN